MGDAISAEFDGQVAVVTMDCPPHNFLTGEILGQLADTLEGIEGRCRAAVLRSAARSFCAGANFSAGSSIDTNAPASFETGARTFYDHAIRIFSTHTPLVAAAEGPAIGAGLGLLLACDLRVLGTGAWVQANFVRLGIHPGFAISLTLPALIGPGHAADLLLSGRRVEPDEAHRIGLADRRTDAGKADDVARELAAQVAAAAPLAVASTRTTLRGAMLADVRARLDHELAAQSALVATRDAAEGITAMLQRRDPDFNGS